MVVPGSEEGTPQSIQDRVPSAVSASGMEFPTTVPASPEALRDVMEVTPTGNLFVGVADQAWDAVVPVRESGFVEIDIARDDSDALSRTQSPSTSIFNQKCPGCKTLRFQVQRIQMRKFFVKQTRPQKQLMMRFEVERPWGPRLRAAFLFLDTVDPVRIFRQCGAGGGFSAR